MEDRVYQELNEKFEIMFNDRPNVLHDIKSVLREQFLGRNDVMFRYKDMDDVIESICNITDLRPIDLFSKSRKRHILEARQFAIFKIKEIFGTRYTLKEIGKKSGGRDHTTIIHAIQSCRNKLFSKDEYLTDILDRWEVFTRIKFCN